MITIEELNALQEFYVETSVKGRFFIKRLEHGYELNDINPPILTKKITDIKSCKVPKNIEKNLSSTYQLIDQSKIKYFDGIAKGFSFLFYDDNGMCLTKGSVTTLYFQKKLNNFIFNVHLLEQPGRKIAIHKLLKDFHIVTEDESYKINYVDQSYYFEGRKVLAFYSLFKTKIKNFEIDINLLNEMDVTPNHLHFNKPLIILTEDDTKENRIRLTSIFSNIITTKEAL